MAIYTTTFLDIFNALGHVQEIASAEQLPESVSTGSNLLISEMSTLSKQLFVDDHASIPGPQFLNNPHNCWVILLTREAYDFEISESKSSKAMQYILNSFSQDSVYFLVQHRPHLEYLLRRYPNINIFGYHDEWEYYSYVRGQHWPIKDVVHYKKRFSFINRRNDVYRSRMFHALWTIPGFKKNTLASFNPSNYWDSGLDYAHTDQYWLETLQALKHPRMCEWFKRITFPQLPELYSNPDPFKYEFYDAGMLALVQDTGISIVAESAPHWIPQGIFTTEKTYRPMLAGQPFIVNAQPGYLKYLQEAGYQTFSDAWDESYDDMVDFDRRLDKIKKLVASLNQMNDRQFKKILDRTRPAVLHNRATLARRCHPSTVLGKFFENAPSSTPRPEPPKAVR